MGKLSIVSEKGAMLSGAVSGITSGALFSVSLMLKYPIDSDVTSGMPQMSQIPF